jgi:hypothetical protein
MINHRNRVRLVDPGTGYPGHFSLHEFENDDGLVAVHPGTLWGLERIRAHLNESEIAEEAEVSIHITDGVRTQEDLERLATRLGWTDEGGKVSRTSKHLITQDATGVDIIAMLGGSRMRVPQKTLGPVCRQYFDFVKDDYDDGHVHVDNRDGGRVWNSS